AVEPRGRSLISVAVRAAASGAVPRAPSTLSNVTTAAPSLAKLMMVLRHSPSSAGDVTSGGGRPVAATEIAAGGGPLPRPGVGERIAGSGTGPGISARPTIARIAATAAATSAGPAKGKSTNGARSASAAAATSSGPG